MTKNGIKRVKFNHLLTAAGFLLILFYNFYPVLCQLCG